MPHFQATSEAIAEWQANVPYGIGDHLERNISTSIGNVVLGEVQFDPHIHDPSDIDHMSMMGIATGELYVPEVLPQKPLNMNVIIDATTREDHPSLIKVKRDIAHQIYSAIDDATIGMSDRVFATELTSRPQKSSNPDFEIVVARNNKALQKFLGMTAINQLAIVISDFKNFDRRHSSEAGKSPMVAVKVNHPAERRIPYDVGILSLGGYEEINTNKHRRVDAKNAELEAQHREIVEELEAIGAEVAEVITKPFSATGYEVAEVDAAIATAISNLQNKHNY
jgi:hypothetical protein